MRCWALQGFIPSLRSCRRADERLCPSRSCPSFVVCSEGRSTCEPKANRSRQTAQQAVAPLLCTKASFSRAKVQPAEKLRREASAQRTAATVASQTPLPPLPIERGDNTLTRTLSGLILGAFGSLCIYSGGLLFTGTLASELFSAFS